MKKQRKKDWVTTMALHIHNTLTRTKQAFTPLEPGKVKMYVCGPTVYGYIHIGNARPVVVFDVVRRYLINQDYDVNFVMNFTDVDDKLIRKAEEMGKTVPEVAEIFIDAFMEDIEGLGVLPGAVRPRVTENIPEIITLISTLEAKGFAYEAGGDVFFRSTRFEEYGKLSQQNLDDLQFGKRIEVDPRKENPQDFVLWKAAKPGEIAWASPWGDGRPGWHIECSAMAGKYLGNTIDIHGGGQDLTFPHHECEIAQSEACNDQQMANYWMHNGYVNINNEKMSKSLNNFITVVDLRTKYKKEVLRFFILSAHYRNPLNFNEEVMQQAEQSVARIANGVSDIEHRLAVLAGAGVEDKKAKRVQETIGEIMERFHERMQDDFNTPDAITAIFDLVSLMNQYLMQATVHQATLEQALSAFNAMNEVLGVIPQATSELLDADIEALIVERTEARQSRNWARADEIRDQLLAEGIVLEDTPQGIRWKRK
jgi:cysteinyl-tRNA synthetase